MHNLRSLAAALTGADEATTQAFTGQMNTLETMLLRDQSEAHSFTPEDVDLTREQFVTDFNDDMGLALEWAASDPEDG